MEAVSDFERLEAYQPAITGHCYRMLGSFVDAEDATQDAMIRAWKGLDRFDGRASLKNWLYRIATNVCLDEGKTNYTGRVRYWSEADREAHETMRFHVGWPLCAEQLARVVEGL
jgi:RNA polymerase sigma factor (sigma-70 family)